MSGLTRRRLVAAAGLIGVARPAVAQPVPLTIGSFHPLDLPWAQRMVETFIPEADRRLAATPGAPAIAWRQAFGGALFDMRGTLTAVQSGRTDISWVYGNVEAERLPLLHVALNAPFVTDDLRIILPTMNALNRSFAPLRDEWAANGVVFLGASGVDTYHLFTRFPVERIGDLRGRRIGLPAALRAWMSGSGATLINGSLDGYERDLREDRIEGILSIPSGVLPRRLYELAPYVTLINLGAVYNAGLAINAATWARLVPPVQDSLRGAGEAYSAALATQLMDGHEKALRDMVQAGAAQATPVRITSLPADDRRDWIQRLDDVGGAWMRQQEAKGLPGRAVMAAYMDGVRARGASPARDWDR